MIWWKGDSHSWWAPISVATAHSRRRDPPALRRPGMATHGTSSNVRAVDIREATSAYERWLKQRVPVLQGDLDLKHRLMAADEFAFLRATFYRWAQLWPEVCPEVADAPQRARGRGPARGELRHLARRRGASHLGHQ